MNNWKKQLILNFQTIRTTRNNTWSIVFKT